MAAFQQDTRFVADVLTSFGTFFASILFTTLPSVSATCCRRVKLAFAVKRDDLQRQRDLEIRLASGVSSSSRIEHSPTMTHLRNREKHQSNRTYSGAASATPPACDQATLGPLGDR